MKNNYSNAMKKIMKKPSLILTHLFFIVFITVLIGMAGYGYISEKSKFEDAKVNTELFDPYNEKMEFGQITPLYMSDEFAANYDDTIYYRFLVDEQYYSYIVAVYADQMDRYEDIIEYTYSDVEEPESITFTGKSIEIESDLLGFAADAYNVFMGTNTATEDNLSDYVGFYYIDTTEQPHINYWATIEFLVIAIIIGMCYFNSIFYIKKALKRRKETLATYSENLLEEVDKEINKEDTVYIKSQRLFITKNYIVSSYCGFDIIPLSNINHVYGAYKGNNRIVGNSLVTIVETQDGAQHEIICMKNARKFDKLKDLLVEEIKRRNPEIEFGVEGRFLDSKNVIAV